MSSSSTSSVGHILKSSNDRRPLRRRKHTEYYSRHCRHCTFFTGNEASRQLPSPTHNQASRTNHRQSCYQWRPLGNIQQLPGRGALPRPIGHPRKRTHVSIRATDGDYSATRARSCTLRSEKSIVAQASIFPLDDLHGTVSKACGIARARHPFRER